MSIWVWLNSKRLRDYPRLVLTASGIVLVLNVLLRHGWIGGLTGILMWGDYVGYYAAGFLYKHDITKLYNPAAQEITQRNLLFPTVPPGVTMYSYPPNAAFFHSIFSYLSLTISLFLWSSFSIFCIILAAKLMHRYLVPEWLNRKGLSAIQLSLVIFSTFAFTEGFAAGQMHSVTLLLLVALVITTMKEKWFLAGLLATGLTYKPQFIIGFILIWLVWKKLSAILSFLLSSLMIHGIVLITKGISPYLDYLKFVNNMFYLPFVKEGFPSSILATPYTFIASLLPINMAITWNRIFYVFVFFAIIAVGWLAYRYRKQPMADQQVVISMAILFPLLFTPYSLLHDLLILIPAIILLAAKQEQNNNVLPLAIGVYISMFLLPILSLTFKIALTGLIPVAVFIIWLQRLWLDMRNIYPINAS